MDPARERPLLGLGAGRRVPLPVGTERVVAPALLGIREDLVRLVDLLEAVRRSRALVQVRMVFSRKPAVGLLDRLLVGVLVDAEDFVIVLIF